MWAASIARRAGAAVVKELAPEFPLDAAHRCSTVGTAVLEAVLPPHDGPTATSRSPWHLKQLASALRLLRDHAAARIRIDSHACIGTPKRPGHGVSAKTRWRTTATAASFPEAVRENEEVVPVNAVSTWVLPSGVTVGR